MTSPWRQDVSTPATYGPPPAPAGAAVPIAPIGQPPASAGSPDLLPRNSTLSPTDISAPFGLPAGTIMAFTSLFGEGTNGRAKHVKSLVWTWDTDGSTPFVADQYTLRLVTMPSGLDVVKATIAQQYFINDNSLSGTVPIVKGGYDPPVYVGPNFTAVFLGVNSNAALDPTMGLRQRLFLQWTLV